MIANYTKSNFELALSNKRAKHSYVHMGHYRNSSSSDRIVESPNNRQHLIKHADYKISLVSSYEQALETNKLVRSRYAAKGYLAGGATEIFLNRNQVTFEASNEQHLFGTVTLRIDSEDGLLADKMYSNEINQLRRKNKTICELSKFASYTNHSSKKVFASLFHLAYIYAYILHDVEDAVIEVNPRHMSFYRQMLGFRQIGVEQICKRVNAPAVLLHLDLNHMRQQILSLSHLHYSDSKTIYPYFLSQHEEKRLTRKIEKLLNQEKNGIESPRFFQRHLSLSQATSSDSSN